jgi:hypothetical protein
MQKSSANTYHLCVILFLIFSGCITPPSLPSWVDGWDAEEPIDSQMEEADAGDAFSDPGDAADITDAFDAADEGDIPADIAEIEVKSILEGFFSLGGAASAGVMESTNYTMRITVVQSPSGKAQVNSCTDYNLRTGFFNILKGMELLK